jgi:hypothetical protein
MLISTSMKAKWHAHTLSFVPDQEELFLNKIPINQEFWVLWQRD